MDLHEEAGEQALRDALKDALRDAIRSWTCMKKPESRHLRMLG
jgi:hypothetical protein